MGGLAQQGPDARDGRRAGSGSAHDDVSLRLELRMCEPAARLNPGSPRKRAIVSYRIVAGVYRDLLEWGGAKGGAGGLRSLRAITFPEASAVGSKQDFAALSTVTGYPWASHRGWLRRGEAEEGARVGRSSLRERSEGSWLTDPTIRPA
jgi:hypothetical protein